MIKIIIKEGKAFITLSQLLKMQGIVQSGGEVREFLANNKIIINDQIEVRRGRKLYPKDIVEYDNITYEIDGINIENK